MSAGPPIESLTAIVTLDVTQFTSRVAAVQTALNTLATDFTNFGTQIAGVMNKVGNAIAAPISRAVTRISGSLALIQGEITAFVGTLATLDTKGVKAIGAGMRGMGDFLQVLNTTSIGTKGMAGKANALAGFVDTFNTAIGKIANFDAGNFRLIGSGLGRMGDFLDSAKKFGNVNMHPIHTAISGVLGAFSNVNVDDNFKGASLAISRTTGLINSVGKLSAAGQMSNLGGVSDRIKDLLGEFKGGDSPAFVGASLAITRTRALLESVGKLSAAGHMGNLATVKTEVGGIFTAMGNANPTQMEAAASSLGSLGRSLGRIAYINPTTLGASVAALRSTLTQLSNIPVSDNLTAVANVVQKIGLGMRNMRMGGGAGPISINAGGGGSTPPPVAVTTGGLGGMAGGFRNVSTAARGATARLGDFGQATKALFLTSDTAMKGLQRIQTSLLGVGVLGVAQFARMDDYLTRAMAHMRVFDQNDPVKDQMQRGMFGISSVSRTGAADLARGMDVLVSSGMNATMALENLATAENFAVASGMPMQKATQRLTDLMNGLGLAVEDTAKHKSNMTELADMIVGIASKSGSTEEQLSEAFSGRFINSMKTAKLEVKDAMSLLATYSRFGESTRGAAAGTRLSRGLENMMVNVTSHSGMWDHLLFGNSNAGIAKTLTGIQLLERLSEAIDTTDTKRGTAQMLKLGFDTEGMAALNPLLRHFPTIKLIREEIEKTGGISEKTAALIRSSLLGQLTTLFNAVSTIATLFGERLAPMIHGVTIAISNMSLAFVKLAPWYQNLIIYGSMAFVVMRNFGIVTGLVAFALTPLTMVIQGVVGSLKLLYSGFMLLVSVPGMLLSGFQTVFGYMTYGFRMLFSPLSIAIGLLQGFWAVMVRVDDIAGRVVSMSLDLGGAMWKIVMNVGAGLTGIVVSLLSVVTTLLLIGPLMGLFGTVFAAGLAFSAALAVTLGTALASLASLIGAGLVMAWKAFQGAATAALAWVGRAVTNIHDNIGGMWESLQKGTGDFIRTTAASLEVIAGFFWNFRQNMTTIWTWFGKHGEQAFIDMANAGFKFMSILGGNLSKVFGAVGIALYDSLAAAWMAFMDYAGSFGDWLSKQWPNIVGDLGRIMGVLFGSFKDNFASLFNLIGQMVNTITEQIKLSVLNAGGVYTDAQKDRVREFAKADLFERYRNSATMTFDQYKATKAHLDSPTFSASPERYQESDAAYFQGKRSDAMKGWGGFKAADTDLSKIGFKTDFSGMGPKAEGLGMGRFSGLGDSIKDTFKTMFAGLAPLSGAFSEIAASPMWKALRDSINIALPEGGIDEAVAKFTKMFYPTAADEGNMGMAPPTRSGPGFKFAQISMERTMIGGDVAASLEHQQLGTLKSIDRKQDNIVAAINRINSMGPPEPQRPTVKRGN